MCVWNLSRRDAIPFLYEWYHPSAMARKGKFILFTCRRVSARVSFPRFFIYLHSSDSPHPDATAKQMDASTARSIHNFVIFLFASPNSPRTKTIVWSIAFSRWLCDMKAIEFRLKWHSHSSHCPCTIVKDDITRTHVRHQMVIGISHGLQFLISLSHLRNLFQNQPREKRKLVEICILFLSCWNRNQIDLKIIFRF